MNLLVDIGNTLTKIAVSDGKSIVTEFKLRSIDLDFIKDIIEDNNIKNIAISNVRKPNQKLFDLCDSKSNLYSFKKEIKLPFNNLLNSNSYPEMTFGNKTFESKYLLFKVFISISISNSSILKEADPNPVID